MTAEDIQGLTPLHEHDGKWYFWDEVWANRVGPFDTEKEAREALWEYARSL